MKRVERFRVLVQIWHRQLSLLIKLYTSYCTSVVYNSWRFYRSENCLEWMFYGKVNHILYFFVLVFLDLFVCLFEYVCFLVIFYLSLLVSCKFSSHLPLTGLDLRWMCGVANVTGLTSLRATRLYKFRLILS
jgi:hypothetical protein